MIVFQRKAPLFGALTLILAAWSMPAWSTGGCASTFQGRYGGGAGTTFDSAGCQTCHTSSIPALNGYGADVGQCSSSDFDTAETLDSDTADGQPSVGGNNLAEITAGAQPGWCVVGTPNCVNVQTPPASISGPLDPPQTNEPPVADAGGPYQTELGNPTQFDGTGSSDADGDALTYAWDFGDGNSGTGAQPQHTYAAAGTYTVSLVVSDPLVASAPDMTTATISETVVSEPPVAAVGGPYVGETGASVQFDGSGSSDPEGDPLSYEWDFGDGAIGSGVMPSHAYAAAGTYTVSLVVNDGQVGSPASSTTATISDAAVNEPPVAVIGGPYSGEAGTALQFDGSASFDPDGSIQSYSWDFGDGNSGSGATPIHTYASAGSFTVNLVVSDGSVDSAAATTTADIAEPPGNTPPIADVGGPYSGITGTPVQLDGSGSSDPNGDSLIFRWDFGDGSVGDGEMPSHGFAAAGTYTVTLQVNDGEFDSAPDATTVAIGDPATGGDGEALYRVNCLGCHGSPWEAPAFDMDALPGVRRVAGARECTIEGSIFGTSVYPGGVPSMQYLQDALTDEEIAAIAEYLNSSAATGEQRHIAACAGCHGLNGSGGEVGEDIHGEDAGDIAEAIEEDDEMRFLGCLPESDIVSIGEYLMSFDDDQDDDGIGDDDDFDDDNDGRRDEEDSDDDDDGLDDKKEKKRRTDPRNKDTDGDGIEDGPEVEIFGSDPLDRDSDNDNVDDGREIADFTDPLDADSDDDDLDDGEERIAGTDPLNPDTDGDGFPDGKEVKVLRSDPLQKPATSVADSSGGGASGPWFLIPLALARMVRRRRGNLVEEH